MDRASIKEFVKEISGANAKVEDHGEWVSASCPFARWKHAGGTDKTMSFGVKVNLYDESIFNCYACKNKGTLPQLLDRLEAYTGEDYRDLKGEVQDGEFLGANLPAWDNRRDYDSKDIKLGEPVHQDYLEVYDNAAGHPYLKQRGITYDTAKTLDLRIDPDNKGVERILFPVFSPSGAFYGYTGRATVSNTELRVRDYFGLPKRLLLLGAEFIKPVSDPYVLLVEGLFDFATIFGFGIPVVGSMHSGLTPQQARILKEFNIPIYVFYDDDKAGHSGLGIIRTALGLHVPVMKVRYPKECTVQERDTGNMRPPADPGELLEYQVLHMIKDARLA